MCCRSLQDISIHALLAESDQPHHRHPRRLVISIHALLAESDHGPHLARRHDRISIHALLAESDPSAILGIPNQVDFYPRSPCGERLSLNTIKYADPIISIHALLAESDTVADLGKRNVRISIHALLAESDILPFCCAPPTLNFYPRSPCGERRASQSYSLAIIRFLSTLSLRRATCLSIFKPARAFYFYPRSPCGERL